MQGPDVVLGIQWLQNLGKVTHDYARHTMEFTLLDTTYSLKGDEYLRMKRISLHRMQASLEHDEIYGMYEIHSLLMEAEGADTRLVATKSGHLELEQLQDRLIAIHTIKNGEMEKLVNEMLSQALNEITVKDKFPISTAYEMFDELGGAVIFTKLDLRAWYHQVHLRERDLYKTEFRHIICGRGVEMDPKKVTVVHEWMEPKTQRHPGKLNQVTDALSCMFKEEEEESITAAFMSMSQPVVGLLGDLKSENKTLEELLNLHQKIDNGEASVGFHFEEGP
ncbi:hypothetical protein Tco_1441880, partial [Tanacetum coccineum]